MLARAALMKYPKPPVPLSFHVFKPVQGTPEAAPEAKEEQDMVFP